MNYFYLSQSLRYMVAPTVFSMVTPQQLLASVSEISSYLVAANTQLSMLELQDDGCHLKFATNPVRSTLTDTASRITAMEIVIAKMHFKVH